MWYDTIYLLYCIINMWYDGWIILFFLILTHDDVMVPCVLCGDESPGLSVIDDTVSSVQYDDSMINQQMIKKDLM